MFPHSLLCTALPPCCRCAALSPIAFLCLHVADFIIECCCMLCVLGRTDTGHWRTGGAAAPYFAHVYHRHITIFNYHDLITTGATMYNNKGHKRWHTTETRRAALRKL